MTAILECAREMTGLRQIQLSVAATQESARHLYVELGFRSFGVEPQALQVDGEFIDEEHFYLPLA
jgi:RimJ/RimL family protein N-acetyltransferase